MIQLKLSKFHNRLAIVSVLIYNNSSQVHVLRPDFSGSSYQNHGAFLSVPQLFRMMRSSTSDDLTVVFFHHDGVFFLLANISFFIFENLPKLLNFHFNSFKQTFGDVFPFLKPANTNRNQPKRVVSSLFHQLVILCLQECAETLPNPGIWKSSRLEVRISESLRPHWKRFGQDMLHNQIHKIERLFEFRPSPAFAF